MWVRDIRAVTFSDGGTLRRGLSPDALAASLARTLEADGIDVPGQSFLEAWWRATATRLAARWHDLSEEPLEATIRGILPDASNRLEGVVAGAIESLASSIEWFPDALPTLDFLHESGYQVAVVSDSPAPIGPTWEARFAPWIEAVILSRDVGRSKPDPSPFREAFHRFGLLPKQVLHVGDQVVADVFGGKEVGLHTALLERAPREPPPPEAATWLRREHRLEPKAVIPDLRIRTLEEIPVVLDQFP